MEMHLLDQAADCIRRSRAQACGVVGDRLAAARIDSASQKLDFLSSCANDESLPLNFVERAREFLRQLGESDQ
jgi:hypothetical protein